MCKWEILQEEEALSKSEDLLGRRGAGYVSWRDLLGRGQEGNNTCNSQGEDGLGKLIADICDEQEGLGKCVGDICEEEESWSSVLERSVRKRKGRDVYVSRRDLLGQGKGNVETCEKEESLGKFVGEICEKKRRAGQLCKEI